MNVKVRDRGHTHLGDLTYIVISFLTVPVFRSFEKYSVFLIGTIAYVFEQYAIRFIIRNLIIFEHTWLSARGRGPSRFSHHVILKTNGDLVVFQRTVEVYATRGV